MLVLTFMVHLLCSLLAGLAYHVICNWGAIPDGCIYGKCADQLNVSPHSKPSLNMTSIVAITVSVMVSGDG
jgi:hypothetical protein